MSHPPQETVWFIPARPLVRVPDRFHREMESRIFVEPPFRAEGGNGAAGVVRGGAVRGHLAPKALRTRRSGRAFSLPRTEGRPGQMLVGCHDGAGGRFLVGGPRVPQFDLPRPFPRVSASSVRNGSSACTGRKSEPSSRGAPPARRMPSSFRLYPSPFPRSMHPDSQVADRGSVGNPPASRFIPPEVDAAHGAPLHGEGFSSRHAARSPSSRKISRVGPVGADLPS